MNPTQLLDHFDRISDAPDAIPSLRRFILDLAVRGKLVEQDPKDKPADKLLERIHAEKTRLLKAGEIKKQDVLPAIESDEVPFEVPMHWVLVRLGDALELINGRAFKPSEWSKTGLPIIRIQNLNNADAPFNYCDAPIPEKVHVNSGDFLISWSGTPGTSFGAHIWNRGHGILNQHIFRAELIGDAFVPPFLKLAINSRLLELIDQAHGGVGLQHITKPKLERLPLTLPPLAEQHRIVGKVDELMALCDRLEAAQAERESQRDRLAAASLNGLNQPAEDVSAFHEHARFYFNHLPRLTTRPEHIQQIRQTILNLAVRGELVPQDPNDEPASVLLKRIQAEKDRLVKEGAMKRSQPVLRIESAEIPSAVPDSWEWVRVGDLLLGDSQNGCSKKPDDAPDGIPILRISAGTVRRDGIVAEEEHKFIGGVSLTQQEQYKLQPGDLLACRFNGNRSSVGRLSLYLGYLGIKPIYPDKLIRLRLLSKFVIPKLVRCLAESTVVRTGIEKFCATTVGNWGISASNLKSVIIPLPPLAEQHRIVAKVDELMDLCARLEAQLTTTQTESRRLFEAVLHEALVLAV